MRAGLPADAQQLLEAASQQPLVALVSSASLQMVALTAQIAEACEQLQGSLDPAFLHQVASSAKGAVRASFGVAAIALLNAFPSTPSNMLVGRLRCRRWRIGLAPWPTTRGMTTAASWTPLPWLRSKPTWPNSIRFVLFCAHIRTRIFSPVANRMCSERESWLTVRLRLPTHRSA